MLAKVSWLASENHRLGVVGEYSRASNEINNPSRVGGIGYLQRRADDDGDRDRYGIEYAWEYGGTLFDLMEWSADRVETESRALTTILAGSGCAQNITPCLRSENRATEQTLDRSALGPDLATQQRARARYGPLGVGPGRKWLPGSIGRRNVCADGNHAGH